MPVLCKTEGLRLEPLFIMYILKILIEEALECTLIKRNTFFIFK